MKNLTLSANYNFLNTTKTLLVLVLFSINLGIKAQQDCSDCPTANCIGSSHASYAAAQAVQDAWSPTTSGTFCMEFTPDVSGPVTRYSYHTITASSSGIIGAVISSSETPVSCSSIRTYSLYATSGDCLGSTSPENLVSTNANGSGFGNPEWNGLISGQNYIMKVQYDVIAGCSMRDQCVTVYSSTVSAAPCVISQTNTITDDCSSPTTFDVQFTITFSNDPGGNLIIRDTDAGNDEYTIAAAGITSPHVFTVTLTKGNGTTNYEAYFSADNTCSTVFTITEPNCSCAAGAGTFSN
jgi:hypothetical protein